MISRKITLFYRPHPFLDAKKIDFNYDHVTQGNLAWITELHLIFREWRNREDGGGVIADIYTPDNHLISIIQFGWSDRRHKCVILDSWIESPESELLKRLSQAAYDFICPPTLPKIAEPDIQSRFSPMVHLSKSPYVASVYCTNLSLEYPNYAYMVGLRNQKMDLLFKPLKTSNTHSYIVKIWSSKVLVGRAYFIFYKKKESTDIDGVYIKSVFIYPFYRRQGIGSSVITWIGCLAEYRSLKSISLPAINLFEESFQFWDFMGAQPSKPQSSRNIYTIHLPITIYPKK